MPSPWDAIAAMVVIVVQPDEYHTFVTEVVGPFADLERARAHLQSAGWVEDSWRPKDDPEYRAPWRKNPRIMLGGLGGDYKAEIHRFGELP